MDILNFISWIRGRRQVTSVDPARSVLPVGLKDPKRDDDYIAGAISVADFTAQVASVIPSGPQGVPGSQGPQGVPGPVGPAGLNWQGLWSAAGTYVVDDAVGYGGASWFCINNVGPSATSPNADPTNWALLAAQGATGPQGPAGPPSNGVKIIGSAPTFGTLVTGTTVNTVSRAIDISGLLSANSTIDISWGSYIPTSTNTVQSQVWLSTSTSLAGAIGQIATGAVQPSGPSNQYLRNVRHIANVDSGGLATFRTFNSTQQSSSDLSNTNNAVTTISGISLSGPLYLLFTIVLSSPTSAARIDRVVINELPATVL